MGREPLRILRRPTRCSILEKLMTFRESLASVGRQKYATFTGRASRSEFWWWYLSVVIAAGIAGAALMPNDNNGLNTIIQGIITVGLFIPTLAVGVRRLHDTNRSGWNVLWQLIPIVGFIIVLVFLVQDSDASNNSFGPPPQS